MQQSTLPKEWEIVERATTRIPGLLTEEDLVTPIPGSVLTTFRLTIYDNDVDQTVIVNDRNILNANGCTVDEDGNVVLILQPPDTLIRTATLPFERHTCLFEWTWPSTVTGQFHTGRHELILVIRNLSKVS